jgi:hypothetical protein
MEALGLGPAAMCARNPRLVYCEMWILSAPCAVLIHILRPLTM